RQRCFARLPCNAWHPASDSQQSNPKANQAVRSDRLPTAKYHRTHLLRLKDWRRVATRYDKLMINFAATCYIAAIVTWWIN
ncbi:MAG: hypothetical protein ACODTL_07960, partial [Brucella sp.]